MNLTHSHRAVCAAALCPLFALLLAASASAEDELAEADDETADEEAIEVPVVVEAAEIEVQPGHVRYDDEFIAAMPGGESNLADLLRANPAVDFGRESELSKNSAVQRPAEISIHGQPFYQNAYLIDGIDTSNDLNPANSGDIFSTPSLTQPHGGGSPQAYYVDTSLIESVEGYDSNVPAEYGGFTGGVVAADLKRYDGENSVSVGYSLRRDEWEEFHVTEDDLSGNDYYNAGYTPDYRRSHMWVGVQRGVGALGLSLTASRRSSTFAQRYDRLYYPGKQELRQLNYDDVIDNVLGRIDTDLGRTAVGVAIRHAKRRHDGVTSTTYDGLFDKEHNGDGLTLDVERAVGGGTLEIRIGLDRVRDVLESDTSRYSYHQYAETSATEAQYEGAFGDSRQSQARTSVRPKLTMATRTVGKVEHSIVVGGELARTDSYYERPEDVVFEQYLCVDRPRRDVCQDHDGDGAIGPGDEYLARMSKWVAGKVDLTYGSAALHAEDRIAFEDWQVNVGLRIDWNDYLGNVDVSPRISVERDVFGDDRTILVAGVNRYYGRSFFRYELNDAIYGWREFTYYNRDGSVRRVTTYDDRSGRSDLATPYSDEWMLGWTQALGLATARLQFVNREGRDGVSRARDCLDPTDTRCREYNYIYTNEGRSSTQSVGLRLASADAIRLGPTETTFSLGLSYRESTTNYQEDALGRSGYDEQILEDLIYYDGELTTVEDLPPWDYNVPFGTSFFAVTSIPGWNVTWSNFVNVRRGGTVARDSGLDCDDEEIDYCEGSVAIYEDFEFDGLATMDARVEWRPELMAEISGYLRLEVKNLFDDVVDTNASRTNPRRRITSGRLFWAEVGLRF